MRHQAAARHREFSPFDGTAKTQLHALRSGNAENAERLLEHNANRVAQSEASLLQALVVGLRILQFV